MALNSKTGCLLNAWETTSISRPQMLRIFVTLIIGDVLSNDPKLQDAHKAGAVSKSLAVWSGM